MSGALTIEDTQTWILAGWAYRMLLDRMMERLSDADDLARVERGKHLGGLDLDWFQEPQRHRIAQALATACFELQAELKATSDDPRDQEYCELLAEIETKLRVLYPDLEQNTPTN